MPVPIVSADEVTPDFGITYNDEVKAGLMRAPTEVLLDLQRKQEIDPVTMGWRFPSWEAILADWHKYTVHVALGGNRCISGDTAIYDPVDGSLRPIKDRPGPFHVLAWDGSKLVPAPCSAPFTKGVEPMLAFTVNGLSFKCTANHRLMRPDGSWVHAGAVRVGDELADGLTGSPVVSITPVPPELVYDLTVPGYANYWAAGVIHHNSGKSKFFARLTLHLAMTIPGFRGRCWSMNDESSVNDQQKVIWEELPQGYKELGKRRATDYRISYTQANGFAGGKLILPPVKPGYPGSEIIFQTYRSWSNDPQVAEGWWCHFLWADEEIPLKLFETLIYRLYDARGRMGLSFTTLNGWTPLIADLLSGAKTINKRYAPLVQQELPIKQESKRARTVIHYLWTQDNVFIPYEDFLGDLKNRPKAEVLSRAYGVPTKSKASKFPLFNRDVHVVKHEDIPLVKNPKLPVTWATSLDPAGSKPWCMGWGYVDAADRLWIVREWPDVPTFGEWVDPSGDEGGKPGPGQKGLGYGINDYVDVILEAEKDMGCPSGDIARSIDPRMGASETQGENGAETIISRLQDKDLIYLPAPGKQIEDGEQLINDRLSYDPSKPVGVDNSPKLFISDRCENLIWALENYAGLGQHEPCKDPVDWLRYMLQSGVEYVDPKTPVSTGGGGY